jgi:predicted NAD-dependent protein-ADP-ribosyltransferase YbiA (DUF1768 family)
VEQLTLPVVNMTPERILFWSKSDRFSELSNFAPARIELKLYGEVYRFRNAEAAYQAQKTRNREEILHFSLLTGLEAKH